MTPMRRTEDGHENTFTSSPVSSLLELISVQLPSQRPLPNTPHLPPSTSDGEVRGPPLASSSPHPKCTLGQTRVVSSKPRRLGRSSRRWMTRRFTSTQSDTPNLRYLPLRWSPGSIADGRPPASPSDGCAAAHPSYTRDRHRLGQSGSLFERPHQGLQVRVELARDLRQGLAELPCSHIGAGGSKHHHRSRFTAGFA